MAGERGDVLATLVAVVVLVLVAVAVVVTLLGVWAVDTLGSLSWLLGLVIVGGLAFVALRRRRARAALRALRQRAGDPYDLQGEWRGLLRGAWDARNRYVATVGGMRRSPVRERLAGHRPALDEQLVACGGLARRGHELVGHVKSFHVRRVRRELAAEQRSAPQGPRAQALARRLADIRAAQSEIDATRLELEERVHLMRTIALRAVEVATSDTDADLRESLDELAADVTHLNQAQQVLGASDGRPAASAW